MNEMSHHGIIGMKWGIRRYRNQDGSLTAEGQKRIEKKDTKWAHKNYDKIMSTTRKKVSKDLDRYAYELLNDPDSFTSSGKISSTAINAYNKKMAELMNRSSKDITSPSGKVIRFIAKRGDIGVHMALANNSYDINQLKNGIWSSGRVAYKKKNIDMV